MSTRSTIGYRTKGGKVSAVYCHFDGYPEWMANAIPKFIAHHGIRKFMSEIRRAQKQGGIRSIHAHPGRDPSIETYGDLRSEKSTNEWTRTQRHIDEGCFDEYAYIVNSTTGRIGEFYMHLTKGKNLGTRVLVDMARVDVSPSERFTHQHLLDLWADNT